MTIKTVQREATLECQTPRATMMAITVDDDHNGGSGKGSKGERAMVAWYQAPRETMETVEREAAIHGNNGPLHHRDTFI